MLPNGRSRDSFSTGYHTRVSNLYKLEETTTDLCTRDTQEADRHEHTGDSDLVVAELDAIEVLHAQAVRRDEAIQREDLVHLDGRNERAASLPDDMRDCRMVSSSIPIAH